MVNEPDLSSMNKASRRFLIAGAVSALLAVVLGAFGAHALGDRLGPDLMAIYETANTYHFYHSLALLSVGFLAQRSSGTKVSASGWCFIAGLLFFSGSLYALALSGVRILGAITPIGGVFFITGWALFALAVYAAAGQRADN
jgi:uncharacterized membrane protein YgdD (TMEM256/DUF423 family)